MSTGGNLHAHPGGEAVCSHFILKGTEIYSFKLLLQVFNLHLLAFLFGQDLCALALTCIHFGQARSNLHTSQRKLFIKFFII